MKKALLPALAAMLLAGGAHAQTLYGITSANTIFSINDVTTPSVINGPYSITGIASGQVLVGIDSRATDGGMYALGYDSVAHIAELYRISASGTTYTATAVSGTLASMDLGSTNNVAFDFVSTMDDQIRVIGRNGNHYVMSATTGSVMTTGSTTLSYAAGDLYATGSAMIAATAYTNNFYGSDATQEVGYDAVNNVLVKFDAGTYANGFNNTSGTIHSIGLGLGTILVGTGSIGMDNWYNTSTHTNTLYMTGSTLLTGAHLYKYDLTGITGVALDAGAIGDGTLNVRDIAFGINRDSTSATTGHIMTALSLNLRNLLFFDAANPNNIRHVVRLSGMATGQSMIALDYAASGMLYGLGYNSTLQNYQLYMIDSATGHATAINSVAASLALGTDDGSGNHINIGFRFIPTDTGRIRIIGNNGATNVQISAATGLIVTTNTGTQYVSGDTHFGATASLSSVAYTGYNGDTATQMFGFDVNTGAVVTFSNNNDALGFGNGSSGYISTGISLDGILSLLLHTNVYNNAHMNIMYDQAANMNVGYMASNYFGDSSDMVNYSVLYDMSGMLSGYHKGTAATPTQVGTVGAGVPVKDISGSRYYTPVTTVPTNIATVMMTGDAQVYPNPTVSVTKVVLPTPSIGDVHVYVIDLNGNTVRKYTYAPKSYALDVDMSNLPVGLYNVRVAGKGISDYNLKVTKN